jgi:alanine dehydrogenase
MNIPLPDVTKLNGAKAIFLLGTDQYIGEGLDEDGEEKGTETRVGIVPDQIKEIREWLMSNGVALDFFFVKGAGTRADFLDSAYLKAGGQMLFEHQLSSMIAPHVVHALKEPSAYETFIPGPFLRIGALHSGAFDDTSGVAFLFERRNFCAIFDGSSIGTVDGKIPIRGSMSIFAGEIATEFSIKHLLREGITGANVIISGGGVAGRASLNKFVETGIDEFTSLTLVEPNENTVASLSQEYRGLEKIKIVQGSVLTTEHLQGANCVILTAFVKGKSAPDVLRLTDLSIIEDRSIIVDISIDERGGIKIDDFNKEDFSLPEVVSRVASEIEKLGKKIKYIADDHLPKNKPKKASIAHGRAIMPYISMLLYCSAKMGGARQAAKYIMGSDFSDQKDPRAAELLTHLRRGLACYSPAPVRYNKSIISDESNRFHLEDFFSKGGIDFDQFE